MRLALVGDVMLGRLVNDFLKTAPPAYPWGDTLPLLLHSDVRLCNLECALSDHGTPWAETPKTFHFRSDARNVAVLKAANMDFVALANNHVLDYGYDALFDTLDVLDRAGISHAGAGRSFEEAAGPARLERMGVRFALIAFTDNEPAWAATPERAGVYHVPVNPEDTRFQELIERVDAVRRECEILILSAHWGPNWGIHPHAGHIACARALIDHGVDVVFGHSCHVFQGVEEYKGRVILYSAGDFIDDYAVDPVERNDRSFVYLIDTDIGPWHLCLHPTVIRNYQATVARGDEAAVIGAEMCVRSRDMNCPAAWDSRTRCVRIGLNPPPDAGLPPLNTLW